MPLVVVAETSVTACMETTLAACMPACLTQDASTPSAGRLPEPGRCPTPQDPDSICPFTNSSKKLNLPAQTIEDVDVYDAKSSLIVVGNDNNFPYSSSRRVGKADDNELLVLEVGA